MPARIPARTAKLILRSETLAVLRLSPIAHGRPLSDDIPTVASYTGACVAAEQAAMQTTIASYTQFVPGRG